MLSKQFRLKKNSDYNYVFKKGQQSYCKFATFCYAKTNLPEVKIGIVVSKKIGNSVVRNHIKRLLREAIQKQITNIKTGYKIVVLAKSSITEVNYIEIEQFIKKSLIKSELIIDENI